MSEIVTVTKDKWAGDYVYKEIDLHGGPPWGFRIGALTTTEIKEGGNQRIVGAVKIARVNPESKASSVGLREGDLILSVNGEDMSQIDASQPQHHSKVNEKFQENKLRLSILSKSSKKGKNREVVQEKLKTSPSVKWGDDAAEENEDKSNILENVNNPTLGQVSIVSNGNREPPSLLSDIIDELQLAAETTASFLHEMEAHLQEEIDKMQPDRVVRQISTSSTPPSTPKTPVPFVPSSLLIKQEDLQQMKSDSASSEPIPTVWTPPGVPPSPKLGRKFRPVNFNMTSPTAGYNSSANNVVPSTSSPTSKINQNGIAPKSLESPIFSPISEPTLSVSNSIDNSLSKNTTSSSITTTTTSSNLPRYQNPTVVLLQKAREGQLPKGASYLSQANERVSNREPVFTSYSDGGIRQPIKTGRPLPPSELINIPMTSKSTLTGEKEQREWYKRMYESLHVEPQRASSSSGLKYTYPAARVRSGGPPAKSFWAKQLHSNGSVSEPEDFGEEEVFDYNSFNNYKHPPGAIRFNPGKIEDYNPSAGVGTTAARKQRYLRSMQPEIRRHWALYSGTGYDSDTTGSNNPNYIIRKVEKSPEPQQPLLSPAEQKHLYADIQKGGEVPLHGLRKYVPGPGPRDPGFDDYGDGSRVASPSQNIKYSESTVNIHYPAPIRLEEKEYVAEDELRKRQQQAMKRFYEEQRRLKYMKEMEDMERRRHSDNFVPTHKSPIPLNRYEDGDVIDGLIDNTPRPGSASIWQRMTPEPATPGKFSFANNPPLGVARALYNFAAHSPRELQLVKGDLISIRRKIDSNWYEGELKNTKNSYFYPSGGNAVGIFPCSYVEILPEDAVLNSPNYSKPQPDKNEGLARVLYNYKPSHSFELELVKGELVILTRRIDRNWFEGKKHKNAAISGIFPVSYVDVIKEIGSATGGGGGRKPVGQPVAHGLKYASDNEEYSIHKHHYKPNDFNLHDESSDYGEVFSPNRDTRNLKNRKRTNQKLQLITVDTRTGNGDQRQRYRAIYKYKPVHSDELELKDGDVVEVMEQCSDGWFVGTSLRTGLFGTFPGNYVERI